jgi:NAD+ kinase
VLGVNLGSLGFLADVGPEHLAEALDKWQTGSCTIEERMTLQARIEGKDAQVLTAHNDVVVDKGEYSRVIDIDAFVDEQYVQRYTGDGLIVATPAGSTAYALAAGGPILNPGMDALLSVPICPHTLAARPLVLPPSVELRLNVQSKHGSAQVTVDGQQRLVVPSGATVWVRQGVHRARIVHTGLGYPFYEVLRKKLKLGFRLPAERS